MHYMALNAKSNIKVCVQHVPFISTRGEKTRLVFIIRGGRRILKLGEAMNLEGIRSRRMFSPVLHNRRNFC